MDPVFALSTSPVPGGVTYNMPSSNDTTDLPLLDRGEFGVEVVEFPRVGSTN
jgi:hypothetical protein